MISKRSKKVIINTVVIMIAAIPARNYFLKQRELAKLSSLRLICQALHSAAIAYHSDYNEQMSVCDWDALYIPPESMELRGFFGFKDKADCKTTLGNNQIVSDQSQHQEYCPKCGTSETGYHYGILLKSDEVEHLCEMNVAYKPDGTK